MIAASRSETGSLVFVVLARWTLENDQRTTCSTLFDTEFTYYLLTLRVHHRFFDFSLL